MILYNIPPGLTTAVSLYVRNSDDSVGDFVESYNGTSSGTTYTFDIQVHASGDYFCVLNGVSDPVASAIPVNAHLYSCDLIRFIKSLEQAFSLALFC